MARKNKSYPEAFKREAVMLLRSNHRSAAEIERELGITAGLLTRWNRKQAAAEGVVIAPGATRPLDEVPLEERVKQLERENARLRQEQAILKKAVAIFTHPKP